jgi:hypothetical protein
MIRENQYLEVENAVNGILAQGLMFDELACELEKLISHKYGALNVDTNPAVVNLNDWKKEDIEFLVKEYSGFSNDSIHLFYDALIHLEWDGVKAEVQRNLAEEMGSLTKGVPHLVLMRRGYKQELGVETEGVQYSACTEQLLNKMRAVFRSSNNAYLCGALLALEATATFEFKGVEKILRALKHRIDGGEINADSLTGEYILGHVADAPTGENPEDDHYAGMRSAIGTYITPEKGEALTKGFVAVCTALNSWWENITIEIYARRLDFAAPL